MLELIRKWFSHPPAPADDGQTGSPSHAGTIVLYARVITAAKGSDANGWDSGNGDAEDEPAVNARTKLATNRRWRSQILRSDLRSLGLVPRQLAERWRRAGIETAGDAARCEPHEVIGRLGGTERERRRLVVVRRCVRMAATVDAMRPIDAMLLIRIHRRSVRRLAGESAAVVRRDLERFAFSTPGRRLLRGRPLPETAKIAGWIDRCRNRDRQAA